MSNGFAEQAGQSRGHSEMILQSELSRLSELRQNYWEMQQLRERLLRLYNLGVPTEPGPLAIDLTTTQSRRFTAGNLGELFGTEWVEDTRQRIRPIVIRQLRIILATYERHEYGAFAGPMGAPPRRRGR